jgi:hypothetical protein
MNTTMTPKDLEGKPILQITAISTALWMREDGEEEIQNIGGSYSLQCNSPDLYKKMVVNDEFTLDGIDAYIDAAMMGLGSLLRVGKERGYFNPEKMIEEIVEGLRNEMNKVVTLRKKSSSDDNNAKSN